MHGCVYESERERERLRPRVRAGQAGGEAQRHMAFVAKKVREMGACRKKMARGHGGRSARE